MQLRGKNRNCVADILGNVKVKLPSPSFSGCGGSDQTLTCPKSSQSDFTPKNKKIEDTQAAPSMLWPVGSWGHKSTVSTDKPVTWQPQRAGRRSTHRQVHRGETRWPCEAARGRTGPGFPRPVPRAARELVCFSWDVADRPPSSHLYIPQPETRLMPHERLCPEHRSHNLVTHTHFRSCHC